MREHLYPEQELKALGQRILLQTAPDSSSPFPSAADRVVGVLIALIAQGVTFEIDLLQMAEDASGASFDYVHRMLTLLEGRDPSRHFWQASDLEYRLLSAQVAAETGWHPDWDAELARGPSDWFWIH